MPLNYAGMYSKWEQSAQSYSLYMTEFINYLANICIVFLKKIRFESFEQSHWFSNTGWAVNKYTAQVQI